MNCLPLICASCEVHKQYSMEGKLSDEIRYIPITRDPTAMSPYLLHDFCRMVFDIYEKHYEKIGFTPPWTGYFAMRAGQVIGVGGFKAPPVNGKIEIAYGTVPQFEGKGISTYTCAFLTQLARKEAPGIQVIARTLREENASTAILRKNGFVRVGEVEDPEDGIVWEWGRP